MKRNPWHGLGCTYNVSMENNTNGVEMSVCVQDKIHVCTRGFTRPVQEHITHCEPYRSPVQYFTTPPDLENRSKVIVRGERGGRKYM